MEAEREKATPDAFNAQDVPRHLAVTILPVFARELLELVAVASAEFEVTDAMKAFTKELAEFNSYDLGETIENAIKEVIGDE